MSPLWRLKSQAKAPIKGQEPDKGGQHNGEERCVIGLGYTSGIEKDKPVWDVTAIVHRVDRGEETLDVLAEIGTVYRQTMQGLRAGQRRVWTLVT